MNSQHPLVLDIETLPLAAALNEVYPRDDRSPPSNWKDAAKIAEWYVADEKKWRTNRVHECSLNPRLGRVLCIGMTTEDNKDVSVTFAKTEADEPKLLRAFWETIGMEAGEVVTWHGSWDLRFLIIRSMVHGINPTVRPETVRAWFRKYSTYPHFDVRAVLTNWEQYEPGDLTEWARFFSLPERPENIRHLTGADVARLYAEGDFTTLELYAAWDVADTQRLYERVAPMLDTRPELKLSA